MVGSVHAHSTMRSLSAKMIYLGVLGCGAFVWIFGCTRSYVEPSQSEHKEAISEHIGDRHPDIRIEIVEFRGAHESKVRGFARNDSREPVWYTAKRGRPDMVGGYVKTLDDGYWSVVQFGIPEVDEEWHPLAPGQMMEFREDVRLVTANPEAVRIGIPFSEHKGGSCRVYWSDASEFTGKKLPEYPEWRF